MSYIFTANNDDYNFKKVDGTLLSFPNNGSKWSLMKTPDNKYSWIPANDLTGLNINTYKFVNNQITIDSCLFIIVTFKITNIAYYANTVNKPILKVSDNTNTLEYKLKSYVEDNQLFIPFKSSNPTTIKFSESNEGVNEGIIKDNSVTVSRNSATKGLIELIDCITINV